MPEPWPEQEALIHLRKKNFKIMDLHKEHKSMLKGRGNSLKLQEMQMNKWIPEQW